MIRYYKKIIWAAINYIIIGKWSLNLGNIANGYMFSATDIMLTCGPTKLARAQGFVNL
jgi:hypothetical protein